MKVQVGIIFVRLGEHVVKVLVTLYDERATQMNKRLYRRDSGATYIVQNADLDHRVSGIEGIWEKKEIIISPCNVF